MNATCYWKGLDFKVNGVPNPTNGDLLGAYFNLKLR